MQSTVVGYFPTRSKAESAIDELKDAGFDKSEIGLAVRSGLESTRGPSGEHHGTGTWEKIRAFFSGDSEPSRSELEDQNATRSSYSYDDVHQSLSGLSVTDEQSGYFRSRFGTGGEGAIVTVSAPGRESDAWRILEKNGGDVGNSAEGYEYSEAETSGETPMEGQNIRLYGEVLRVHTDRVNRGEARLRKEVHTSTQTVEVPVKREELVVERVPVQGEQAAGASEATFQNQEVRIPLSEERARVEKQPVVREEVRVGKKEVTDTEKFDEQVRSEDLNVEENAPGKKRVA